MSRVESIIALSLFLSSCASPSESHPVIVPTTFPSSDGAVLPTVEFTLSTEKPEDIYTPEIDKNEIVYLSKDDIRRLMHLQSSGSEYTVPFAEPLNSYIRGDTTGKNTCGQASMLTILDLMMYAKTNTTSALQISSFMNKYFIRDGELAPAHDGKGIALNRNGTMSPSAVASILEQLGTETNLWSTKIILGNENFSAHAPLAHADTDAFIARAQTEVFSKGGVLIGLFGRNTAWGGTSDEKPNPNYGSYGWSHYAAITGMRKGTDGRVYLSIIDSQNGYVGEVDLDAYAIPYFGEEALVSESGTVWLESFYKGTYDGLYWATAIIPTSTGLIIP